MPPGVRAWDLYSAGNDIDVYRAWANAITHGGPARHRRAGTRPGSSRSAPSGTARSRATTGSRSSRRQFGEWVIDAHLPPPGTPTQPVEAGYMANACVRMRHPDFDALRGMLDNVGRTLHVYAS